MAQLGQRRRKQVEGANIVGADVVTIEGKRSRRRRHWARGVPGSRPRPDEPRRKKQTRNAQARA